MRFREFWQDEDGPTGVEYAVLLALVIVAVMAAIQSVADIVSAAFQATAEAISL
jgi:pilus assembly protein Flp/PilA